MTTIEAAEALLKEFKKPMTSRQLAKEIINRKMVKSNASDQTTSLAATILKMLKLYNNIDQQLCFWNEGTRNRLIGLKEWKKQKLEFNTEELENEGIEEKSTITLPYEIVEKLYFTSQSNIKPTFEEYVAYIIQLGLEASKDEVKEAFERKLKVIYI